ncbi:serine hydrolase [Bradyrhizobium sp. Tv2a-2]|uniref:serine hydrolase n=1 Tax=Bradyrhizobium sp. Tv2a-2 TaxID=113395 RepID=UPI00041C77AD|nr:serine hydrolase [Bradyrhizobium sp. Tv2a-2]
MSTEPATTDATIAALTPGLDALAAEAMAEWQVPAATIAIVQNGETVLVKAYGQRDVEAGLPATPQTHFTICSITKTFAATGLAMLVDEGRLDWTKPVRDYVPEFRLHDAIATDRITVRDLLCHHSGLPRHDWIWMLGDLSRAEMLAATRHIEPSRDIRTEFQYSNLGYNIASIVAERITGLSWEELTRTRIAEPLQMPMTFTVEELAATEDVAVPYLTHREQRQRTKFWPIGATAAGGINTSVAALANWMKFLLAGGEFQGKRLLSASLLREMQMPRVHDGGSEFPEFGESHYGLGFGSTIYRGERVVGHSGGWIGFSTLMRLVPERNLGVAVFCNVSGAPIPSILINYVIDRTSGKEPVPWLDRLRDLHRKGLVQQAIDEEQQTARRKNAPPSHDLSDYAGTYQHPAYGRIEITRRGDNLHWAYRTLSAELAHRHYETFEVPRIPFELNPDRLAITFTTDRDGNVASLSAQFEVLVPDIVFTRAPGGDCMDAAFRTACTGRYKHGSIRHVVAQEADGALTLKPDYQPLYHLRPYQGGIFTIVELEGFRLEFRRGASGAIDELVFHQPNGTFIAQRDETEATAP